MDGLDAVDGMDSVDGMDGGRGWLERLVQRSAPGFDAEFRPRPEAVVDGVWSLVRHLRIPPGPVLPSRTTLVRDAGGGILVVSPPPPHPDTYAAIEALGPVRALVAPNSFHYLYFADAVDRYPEAERYVAPGLEVRVPHLPKASRLPAAALDATFDQVVLHARPGVSEVILFHRASRTLILTDCAFNLAPAARFGSRLFWRLFGVPSTFGPSRTARLMLLPPRERAAPILRKVLEWPFERVLVAHGEVLGRDARAEFERAFAAYL